MPHDLQHEAITKFLIPDHPQQDNYPDPDEWEEKEKEWEDKWDLVLVQCVAWVEKEQVVEARHAVEAAHVAAEKQKVQDEVGEDKKVTDGEKKVGTIMDVVGSGLLICARCSLKGLSSYFFFLSTAG